MLPRRDASYGLGLACFAVAVAVAGAARFQVGGANGWSVPPAGAESLNTWAEKIRFQVGDTLEFVYPKDLDSVLLVEPADYNACNTSSYDKKFDDGDTVFALDRSGAFFFISGVDANCRANEKLIVMVLAAGRNGTGGAPAPSTPSSPPPAPSAAPPPSSPSSPPPPAISSPPPPSPPAPASKAPATAPPPSPSSAPPPASAPTKTPSTPPPAAPASTPPSAGAGAPPPSAANSPAQNARGPTTNSTGTSPPPAGSKDRNGAALSVAGGLATSLGACVLGFYAMLAL